MADPVVPLALPDGDYLLWLTDRVEGHLARARAEVARLKAERPTGHAALEGWNEVELALSNVLTVASLMAQVHLEEPVRDRAEKAEQDAERMVTDLGQDRELYSLLADVDPDSLDAGARRLLERSLRDFRRAGVDRPDDVRDRLRELAAQETELGQTFSKNIRDGVRTIRVRPEQLDGLPEDFRAAHAPGEDGLVELTTEYPDYVPVMTFAHDRSVRGAMVEAFLSRAWPVNDQVLRDLLLARREHAALLGYDGWPSYDAEVKMIAQGALIPDFLQRIAELSETAGVRDYDVLLRRMRQDHPDAAAVDGRDKSYYAEVVRREGFDVDAQEVRRYFEFARVRAGLLEVTGRLLGLAYDEVPDAPVWHDDVTAYDVRTLADGEVRGRIYLDLHPRANKYSHAAQFTLAPGVAGRQLPEGVLVCNFPRGLMEHDDVVTLFHEFGHLVHHILAGRQDWVRFSGVSTEWDFVEAPSQMLEEWAWDPAVLRTFAVDDRGEPIPTALVDRMKAAKEFGKGYHARTQMFYAAASYFLHQDVPDDLTAAVQAQQERYDLFAGVPGTHFHASFGHLGGYTSAYYTYMWSLVIAKDLFSAFDPEDLFAPEVARRYRDRVLAPGGSADAADLVADFLGRPYSFDAFESWLART